PSHRARRPVEPVIDHAAVTTNVVAGHEPPTRAAVDDLEPPRPLGHEGPFCAGRGEREVRVLDAEGEQSVVAPAGEAPLRAHELDPHAVVSEDGARGPRGEGL